MMNTVEKGTRFEKQLYDFIVEQIREGKFPVSNNHKVFMQKAYFSETRKDYIKFDVTIEEYIEGFEDFFRIIIFECKNYNKNISADKIDEFYSKCQQIGKLKGKGIFVSTTDLSESAKNSLKSAGMGFMRFFNQHNTFRTILPRKSPYRNFKNKSFIQSEIIVSTKNFLSQYSGCYYQNPKDFFFNFLGLNQELKLKSNSIKFLSNFDLEDIGNEIVKTANYNGGAFDIFSLLDNVKNNFGYQVIYLGRSKSDLLGYVDFDKKLIGFFIFNHNNDIQARFTVAHELSHILLEHGKYLINDIYYDNHHFILKENSNELKKLETQANYLASCILIPKLHLIEIFNKFTSDFKNKGFGKVYIDNQPCNLQPYLILLKRLSLHFVVSKQVMEIRLKDLNLINDCRN